MARAAKALGSIVAAFEKDILFGKLRTGERFIEDELIERFSVSRHVAARLRGWSERRTL